MDDPKTYIYAAVFLLAAKFGADIDPAKIPFIAQLIDDAQARAAYIVATGDISEMAPLLESADMLQQAEQGDMDALLTLIEQQEQNQTLLVIENDPDTTPLEE